ncbi:hydroxymethylglutaryl-coenzyme A synthase C terminal-domain-containing protein [Pyronema domesticum]|uniref:Hydroxymethylglutaryl-CoA synthase n=1 Tax=Pyronema omphalodes (strain CBS 100304) TaxID=1076935 RepID=U4LSA1_PYROM|nr:hydroxymethylglutaryl-coenzyme A synthase C terminal-domain-containing protein [Pyronema domesticum]CCX32220.1 Similar to Hydroxymethylglutaryl-CoA synthase; acc. no. P54839 [Pyronema omphalodes CBS 100304]
MSARPENIGIKAIDIYFPNQCVEQSELEKFDGVSAGKYTIGLGQTKMAFCDDREDIYSMALTVTQNLIEKYNIDVNTIGRLEVGTETLLDKSKSVKSVLMKLFGENTNVEGVDSVNACYGGTNALFNAINWVESSAWDGRNALVVCGDIALYAKGAARPTGGAGAVAMLIGPDAPLVFEPGKRGSYMAHAYDFYKPDLTSEYPYVDGHFSIRCYTEAVDACYKAYNKRAAALSAETNGVNGAAPEGIDRFDYMLFHAPTCKLVAKSYARLLYNDFINNPSSAQFADVPAELRDIAYEASLSDRNIEKTFVGLSKKRFSERVQPSIELPTNCGNMYTASLYSGLTGLLKNVDSDALQGKRVAIFSYGSGLASSMFSFTVKGSTKEFAEKMNLTERLAARNIVAPEVYDAMCELRHRAHGKKNYSPEGSVDTIVKGSYYLTSIDDMFRREYARKE